MDEEMGAKSEKEEEEGVLTAMDVVEAPKIEASTASPSLSQLENPSQDAKEQRRHKRRKIRRLVKRSKGFPSFVEMLTIDYDAATSSESEQEEEPPREEDTPAIVLIDIDVHLGLKAPSPVKIEPPRQPERVVSHSTTSPEDEGWYEGTVPMAMPEDATYLSELQQLIRAHLDLFSATRSDTAITQAGRRTPTVRGKVGIRCVHCARAVAKVLADVEAASIGAKLWPPGAISYPVNIAGIHAVCSQKPQLHFQACPHMPWEVKAQFNRLTHPSAGTPKRTRRMEGGIPSALYNAIAAKRIGMVDVKGGIRFGRDLSLHPLPIEAIKAQMESETLSSSRNASSVHAGKVSSEPRLTADEASERVLAEALMERDDPTKFLAKSSDKNLVTDYFFLAIKQTAICHVVASDFSSRGKKTKLMRLGYAGFCCRHCMEPDGAPPFISDFSCRSFASAADNMSSAISNSFTAHLHKCYKAPAHIKKALTAYKRIHQRQMAQLPYGSQRRLIHELWTRLRAADLPEVLTNDAAVDDSRPPQERDSAPSTTGAASDTVTSSIEAGDVQAIEDSDAKEITVHLDSTEQNTDEGRETEKSDVNDDSSSKPTETALTSAESEQQGIHTGATVPVADSQIPTA